MITITLLSPTQQPIQNWNFSDQSLIRIGRQGDNDIVLDQFLQVSRHHLELKQVNSNWELYSQGANGTFINDVLISKAEVKDNDLIKLSREGPVLKIQITTSLNKSQSTPPQLLKPTCKHHGNSPNNLFCIHCGEPLVEEEKFISQYQLLRTLGIGGMGITYLAWDKTGKTGSQRLLVLKEMNADMAKNEKARELFEREARILKSLSHHSIPKYYDFFVENNKKYLAMELIHGENLEKKIYEKGPLTPKQGIELMIQLCQILDYLHSLTPPLVHRDVKPANLILRNVDYRLFLIDFGAVKEIGTPNFTRIGAEEYMAPEQGRGNPVPQSDLFAIGPTLTFLLTKESPIKYYRKQAGGDKLDVSKIPNIPPQLTQVLAKTTEPKSSDRFQTAQELSQALAACLTYY